MIPSREATPEEMRSIDMAERARRQRADGARITAARCQACGIQIMGEDLGIYCTISIYACPKCGDQERLILRMDVKE